MQITRVKNIKKIGISKTLDFEVDSKYHNFYANNIVVSNSHSLSYANLAATCIYLKFKYPLEFFCSLLNMAKFEQDSMGEISKISNELPEFGIKLLPPNLLKSKMDFSVEGNNIRYGLSSIKGVSEKSLQSLYDFRSEYPNKFEMYENANSSKINIRILSALIQAGAIDESADNRCYNVLQAQIWNILTEKEKPFFHRFGEEFDYDCIKLIKHFYENQIKGDNGITPIIKESRYNTIKKASEKYIKIYNYNKKNQNLASWYFEKKLLGYSYSSSLLKILSDTVENLMDISNFNNLLDRDYCNYTGIVTEVKDSKSLNGKSMLKIRLEDTNCFIDAIFYDKRYEEWCDNNRDNKGKVIIPKKEDIIVINGNKSGDIVFINNLWILDEKIIMKVSEIS